MSAEDGAAHTSAEDGAAGATLVLDCRGMRCPLPIIELARHLADVPVGGELEVVATDPAARPDVQAWCRMRGQTYLGEAVTGDGVPAYRVRRVS